MFLFTVTINLWELLLWATPFIAFVVTSVISMYHQQKTLQKEFKEFKNNVDMQFKQLILDQKTLERDFEKEVKELKEFSSQMNNQLIEIKTIMGLMKSKIFGEFNNNNNNQQ